MARSGKMKAKARPRRQGPIAETFSDPFPSKLTMKETARHTEGRRSMWSRSCLRHHAVPFISASDRGSDEMFAPKPIESNDVSQATWATPTSNATAIEEDTLASVRLPDTIKHLTGMPNRIAPPTRFSDRTCQDILYSPWDSSEDEIVFHGRNKSRKSTQEARNLPRKDELDSAEPRQYPITTTPTNSSETLDSITTGCYLPIGHATATDRRDEIDYMEIDVFSAKREPSRTCADDQTAIIDDYIANIDDDYHDMLNIYNMQRGIDTTDMDAQSSSTRSTVADESENPLHTRGGILPEMSDKNYNQVSGASTKGHRKKAKQVDISTTPHTESNKDHTSVSSSGSMQQSLDNGAIWEPGSDEDFNADSDTDQPRARDLEDGLSGQPFQRLCASGSRRVKSSLASSRLLELDLLQGLDILGFSSKAGHKKKKAKRKQRPIDLILSDSELELELESAWQNDREKKKARKQKREELRSQGLLGRGAKKPDLRSKYADGIDIDDFKSEVKGFLLSLKNSLSLPPMNKQQRKLVHEVAGALSLKSNSRGHGLSRFPVLHKTGRTPAYTPKMASQVDKIFSGSKFNRRLAKSWNQTPGTRPGKGRHGRPDTSVSYMDGDVVGASAPEIGLENKGRAMLEKMGWSTGTALGATNNKGILLPVPHIVKNSKAGLG